MIIYSNTEQISLLKILIANLTKASIANLIKKRMEFKST